MRFYVKLNRYQEKISLQLQKHYFFLTLLYIGTSHIHLIHNVQTMIRSLPLEIFKDSMADIIQMCSKSCSLSGSTEKFTRVQYLRQCQPLVGRPWKSTSAKYRIILMCVCDPSSWISWSVSTLCCMRVKVIIAPYIRK